MTVIFCMSDNAHYKLFIDCRVFWHITMSECYNCKQFGRTYYPLLQVEDEG